MNLNASSSSKKLIFTKYAYVNIYKKVDLVNTWIICIFKDASTQKK